MAQIPINPQQITNLLQFIDSTQSETVKEEIFSRLGHECFFCRGQDAWLKTFNGNVQTFLDRINVEHASTYWESLDYTPDRRALVLTGREVQGCACAYAESSPPPQSLCRYCCKHMQEQFFGLLLGQKVEVEITEAYLLGGKRCSTLVRMVGS